MSTRSTSGFRHLLRVRFGVHGARGRLMHCASKRDGHRYWMVKLDDGEFVYPEGIIVDGPGDRVERCKDCGLEFMTDGRSPLCSGCDEIAFGTVVRAGETGYDGLRARGPARRG